MSVLSLLILSVMSSCYNKQSHHFRGKRLSMKRSNPSPPHQKDKSVSWLPEICHRSSQSDPGQCLQLVQQEMVLRVFNPIWTKTSQSMRRRSNTIPRWNCLWGRWLFSSSSLSRWKIQSKLFFWCLHIWHIILPLIPQPTQWFAIYMTVCLIYSMMHCNFV